MMRRAAVSQVCLVLFFFGAAVATVSSSDLWRLLFLCRYTDMVVGPPPVYSRFTQLFAAPLATAKTAEQSVTPPLWSLSSFAQIALDFRGGRCYFYSSGNRIAGRKKLGHRITLWKRAVLLLPRSSETFMGFFWRRQVHIFTEKLMLDHEKPLSFTLSSVARWQTGRGGD